MWQLLSSSLVLHSKVDDMHASQPSDSTFRYLSHRNLYMHAVNLKNKSYFTSKKWVCLGRAENCRWGSISYGKTIGKFNKKKGRKCYFIEKKEEVRRGCFEWKSVGKKQEFRMMIKASWLLLEDSVASFPVGTCNWSFFPRDDSSVGVCNWQFSLWLMLSGRGPRSSLPTSH